MIIKLFLSIFNLIFGKDCKNLSKIQTKLNGPSFNILVLSLTSTKTHKFLDAIKNVCGIETEKKMPTTSSSRLEYSI